MQHRHIDEISERYFNRQRDKGMNTESIRGVFESTNGDRLIGRDKEGARIYLSVELRTRVAEPTHTFETVDHKHIREYEELGISGLVVPKYCRTAYGGGQIIDHLENMQGVAVNGISFARIVDLWERCHLNGMHAGCIHQDKGAHVGSDGQWLRGSEWDKVVKLQTDACPEGYKYGTKWLVKPLEPKDRVFAGTLIRQLIDLPRYDGD